MRLSAVVVSNYGNINLFSYANQWIVRANNSDTLYFQTVDLDQDISGAIGGGGACYRGGCGVSGSNIPALRYLLGIGTANQPYSISVTFPSIDDTKVITLNATQADTNDSSVWSVSIPSSITPNSGNVQFTVYEGTNIRTFMVQNMICVEFPDNCGCDGILPNNNSTVYED